MRLITFQNIELAVQLLAEDVAVPNCSYAERVKPIDRGEHPPVYCFARVGGYVPSMQFFVTNWGQFMGFMKFRDRVIIELEVSPTRFLNMKILGEHTPYTSEYYANLFYNPDLRDYDIEVVIPDLRSDEVVAIYGYPTCGYETTVIKPLYITDKWTPCLKQSLVVSGDGYYRETLNSKPHRDYGYREDEIPVDCPAYVAVGLLRDATRWMDMYSCKYSRDLEDLLWERQITWQELLQIKGGVK